MGSGLGIRAKVSPARKEERMHLLFIQYVYTASAVARSRMVVQVYRNSCLQVSVRINQVGVH
jgi:hypothetical protein